MVAMPITYEALLDLVYQLPPRQRFALLHDVLKSLESTSLKQPILPYASDILANTADTSLNEQQLMAEFWASQSIGELAQAQQVMPIKHIDELCTDGWPAGESIDEFLTTIREWRNVDVPEYSSVERT